MNYELGRTYSHLRNLIFTIGVIFCWLCHQAAAQEVTLNVNDSRNKETVTVKLYDNNEGGYLLDLPLTFHQNQENILFMIVGNENELGIKNSVWMFDKTTNLNDFLKQNKNFSASKAFKKQTAELVRFYDQSENIEKYTLFDYGFESVQASPKPVFFRMKDPDKPALLKLTFYVASSKNDGMHVFTAEAGVVKIVVNLKKNK